MQLVQLAVIEDDERTARFQARVIQPPTAQLPVVPTAEFPQLSPTPVEVLPQRSWWDTVGRKAWGLGIVGTGIFIAYTSVRANAWFGHSLTPDPAAGEIYSRLSVAAEIIACLIPTANQFYWRDRCWWSAAKGWGLMAVALVVVFFAAGGFVLTNINAGIEARQERQTPEIQTARQRADELKKSKDAECSTGPAQRGEGQSVKS
jgi:hypothetical protein